MSRTTARDPYAAIAKARAVVHQVTITFAYGQELTGTMDLSVAQIERMLAAREITPAVYCLECGEHIVDCPKIGRFLAEWPAGWSWLDQADA